MKGDGFRDGGSGWWWQRKKMGGGDFQEMRIKEKEDKRRGQELGE